MAVTTVPSVGSGGSKPDVRGRFSATVPIVLSLIDAEIPDVDRRVSLFSGNVFVYSPRPTTRALCASAHSILERVFGPQPVQAQQRLSEATFSSLFVEAASQLADIVPELASAVVVDFDCDPESTFVGGATLSASTGLGFLAHGLGIPRHPHRDTWYAAAACQLNWWIPLFDLDSSASFAFHPSYWDMPVHNNSGEFRYDDWVDSMRQITAMPTEERLSHPRPLEPIDLHPEIRICCPAGGVIISSVAQLYSAVPNETSKTHFSVHFQSVSERDLEAGRGAANLDANPHGTSLSSFVRCSDLAPIPRELVSLHLERRRGGLRRTGG
jgi:hypothetical protein